MTSALLFVALFAVSCDSNDTNSDPTPPPTPTPEGSNHFQFEITEITSTTVFFDVTPDDDTKPYFFWLMDVDTFTNDYNSDINLAVQSEVDRTIMEFIEGWGGTFEDAILGMVSEGKASANYGNGYPIIGNRKYMIYAAYLNIDYTNQVAKVVDTPDTKTFDSIKVEPSDITFEVEIFEIESRSAMVSITPSNDDSYSFTSASKAVVDEVGGAAEYIKQYTESMGMYIGTHTGAISDVVSYEELIPGTEYIVMTFGFESGVVTTEINETTFTTSAASNPAECRFEFDLYREYDYYLGFSVTPSHNDVDYYFDIAPAGLNAEQVQAYFEEGVSNVDWVSSLEEYLQIFATHGPQEDNTIMTPGVSVIAYAVAIDKVTGTYAGDFYISEPYALPEAVTSENTVVTLTIDKCFDGADLSAYMPWYEANNAYFFPTITQSEDVVQYYYNVYEWEAKYADTTTYDDEWAIVALMQNGMTFPDAELVMPWDKTGLILAVGRNADGNFGPVFRINELTLDREDVLPAEEHPYYTPQSAPTSKIEKPASKYKKISIY